MEGPQLDTPRADAGQNKQVGTSRSILGAGGEQGARATKSEPRGRKTKLRGRGARRGGQGLGYQTGAPLAGERGVRAINLPGGKTDPDQQGPPVASGRAGSPFSAKDTR